MTEGSEKCWGTNTHQPSAHGPLHSRLVIRRGVLRKEVCGDGLGIAQYDMSVPGAEAGGYLVNGSIRPFPILVNETDVG
jgi:hypothetical protein